MTVVLLLAVFAAGVATGMVMTARAMPRLVARLAPTERLEFARKVNRLTRARR